INQLSKHPMLQFKFLNELFKVNPKACQKYSLIQIGLYAQFDPSQLVTFLEQTVYHVEKAKTILENYISQCKDREQKQHLYRAIVYLLGRLGGTNTTDALKIIINKLNDVDLVFEIFGSLMK